MSIQALRANLAHAREEKYEFAIGLQADEVKAALAEFEAQLAEANVRCEVLESLSDRLAKQLCEVEQSSKDWEKDARDTARQLEEANERADGLLADLKTTWRLAKETETQRDAAEARAEAAEKELHLARLRIAKLETWRKQERRHAEATEACESRLRAALEVYAREDVWFECDSAPTNGPKTDFLFFRDGRDINGYEVAQAALKTDAAQPDCGHPFRDEDARPDCGAAESEGKE